MRGTARKGRPYCDQFQATSKVMGLRHEHAVPKKFVIDRLLGLEKPTEEYVAMWLNLLLGVVVTQEEATVLNASFKSDMPSEVYDAGSNHRPTGVALMRAAEATTRECGKTLLVLDVVTGADAARLYER